MPVLQDISTNYYFLADNSSNLAMSGFRLQRGLPSSPVNFVNTKVIQTYRLIAGKVKWIITKMLPACGHTSACEQTVGLEFYDTATSERVVYLTGASTAYCWAQIFTPVNAYFHANIGASLWFVSGRFFPAKKVATQTVLTSQYTSGVQTITETDWVNNANDRFVRSLYQASAIGQYPAYSFNVSETDPVGLTHAPSFPNCVGS